MVIPDLGDDLILSGQTPALPAIGINHPFICVDVEDADRAFLQLRLQAKLLLDCGRQTGGRAQEPSLVTIDDLDLLDLTHLA